MEDKMKEGIDSYNEIEKKATEYAEDISENIIKDILENKDNFNLTTAVIAVSKVLSSLASFMYDTEGDFLADVKKARECVTDDLIPALLQPQPCGICNNCRDGNQEGCINPKIREDYSTSRFIPVVANMLIEYDIFNKVLYMHMNKEEEEKKDER